STRRGTQTSAEKPASERSPAPGDKPYGGGKTLALDNVQLTVGSLDEEWFVFWLGCGTLHFQLDQL
ncbi:MAG: hypothetical protein QOH35_1794, partial [Acidobacteriaceae bacterium]|nr:hypothetical protein [Acidobacteriaceae bacterium]